MLGKDIFMERKVSFSGMSICRAELAVLKCPEGTHSLLFSDGIYGFAVSLKMNKRKKPVGGPGRSLSESVSKRTVPFDTPTDTLL